MNVDSEFFCRFRGFFLKKSGSIRVKMAPVLTAGAATTEILYLRVPDSAGARPMHPPARAPGSADCIGRATNTTDTTHTTRSANTHELTIEL